MAANGKWALKSKLQKLEDALGGDRVDRGDRGCMGDRRHRNDRDHF